MSDLSRDEWLKARIEDALSQGKRRPSFVGFLDEREAAVAERTARSLKGEGWSLWGGYEESERKIFGVFPDYMEPDPFRFPITAITIRFRSCDHLDHRDFLGALLGAGLQRSVIGDILPEEGRCICFVRTENTGFLLSQIDRIGRVGVKLSEGYQEPLPAGRGFSEFQEVVASARLDCVVAAAIGQSREKASRMIEAGLVMKNHEQVLSLSEPVQEGDKLSVRGKGRYIIDRLGPVTKKGRMGIAGRKYQ